MPPEDPVWVSDRGDGTFTNPPLYSDYPDPDIIRVGDDFYFATTTFANSPGLRILHSKDLVNWDLVTHVISRLDGRPEYDMDGGTAYRSGVFAPSLRYHNGTFYVAVTPVSQNTRLYYATDIRGPWQYTELPIGAFDPGLFFDTDGKTYIISSGAWDGTVWLFTLSDDLKSVPAQQSVYFIAGAEGSHLVKRGSWYYLFNSIPTRLGMTVSRTQDLFGTWETRNQIDNSTGGHQGAIVDLADGNWYGFALCDSGPIGRMTNISPIYWDDNWPVWGTPAAPNQIPATNPKPILGHAATSAPGSDDFDSPTLSVQWEWNHNPDNTLWSLSDRPGWLRLKPTVADGFWTARNSLVQKGQGPKARAEIKIDTRKIAAGDRAGFGTFGQTNGQIYATRDASGQLQIAVTVMTDTLTEQVTDVRVAGQAITAPDLYLRLDMDFTTSLASVAYSADGVIWTAVGGTFPLTYDWQTGTFQGEQIAIFCYNPAASIGYVDVDYFSLRKLS